MKTKFIFLFLFIYALSIKAQTNVPEVYDNTLQSTFDNLEKNRVPNGLLLDAAIEYANLKKYDGTVPDSSFTSSKALIDIYSTLVMSRIHSSAYIPKSPEDFIDDWKAAQEQDIIPLAGLFYKYSEFSDITKTNAQNTGDPQTVSISNNQIYDKYINGVWQNPYHEKYAFAISPSISIQTNLILEYIYRPIYLSATKLIKYSKLNID